MTEDYVSKVEESQLRELIRESVSKVLGRRLIMEMAYSRSNYKIKADNEFPQVLINWCLVRYCSIIGGSRLKKHWKGELRGHMLNISRYAIKGNDGWEKRLKVFKEIFKENDYYNASFLTLVVANKFVEENINIRSVGFENTIIDCISGFEALFNAILSRDIDLIEEYVESI